MGCLTLIDTEGIADLGAFSKLEVQVRIPRAGTAGTLALETAAVNEEGAFRAISGASWNLNATANDHVGITGFLPMGCLHLTLDSNDAPVSWTDPDGTSPSNEDLPNVGCGAAPTVGQWGGPSFTPPGVDWGPYGAPEPPVLDPPEWLYPPSTSVITANPGEDAPWG